VALPILPLASLKLNVTAVVPIGKSVALLTDTPPTCGGSSTGAVESVDVAVPPARNAASAGQAPPVAPPAWVAGIEMLAGGVTTGGAADEAQVSATVLLVTLCSVATMLS
jgi:hypothetical protein